MNGNTFTFMGLDLIDLITLFVGLSVFIVTLIIWDTLLVKDPMQKRVKMLKGRQEQLKHANTSPKKRRKIINQRRQLDIINRAVEKLKLMQLIKKNNITEKLAQSGFRQKEALKIFAFAKLCLPIATLLLALLVIFSGAAANQTLAAQAFILLAAAIIGFYVPDLYLRNKMDKRYEEITKSLPDGLDLMVICAEAGLTLDASLNRVAKEISQTFVELADELKLTSIELRFLSNRRQALENLSSRVQLPSIRSVVATLIQTERYGTPLSQSLRTLSEEFRNDRMMKAEEKAAKLPAIMTVPLILFILPVLFVVLLGPASCSVADNIINRGI